MEGNPAELAGLESGDYIVSINKNKIKTSDDIMNIINNDPDRPFGIKLIKI